MPTYLVEIIFDSSVISDIVFVFSHRMVGIGAVLVRGRNQRLGFRDLKENVLKM